MNPEPFCPRCRSPLSSPGAPCSACGDLLAGAREVAVEPLQQEAMVVYGLLESAGLHPTLVYHDESDHPHPIEPEQALTDGAGFMIPVTTSFGVFVPDGEAEDARRILDDARTAIKDEAPE